eukprot:m.83474 g.83474  ORF g.83474 m.83474 type:complete len:424 (-) comp14345_c1_seq3:134-1405(-)
MTEWRKDSELHELFKYPEGLVRLPATRKELTPTGLCRYSILPEEEKGKELPELNCFENRAVGVLMGLVCGDAVGAPLEFTSSRDEPYEHQGLTASADIYKSRKFNRFRLKAGQWTDDASMALCVVDSLLVHETFNPLDLRLRFSYWWHLGYNNAFGYDDPLRYSVGLGGNIGASLDEFERPKSSLDYSQRQATRAGDIHTSGNGSIMRLAGVPIRFAAGGGDLNTALDVAWRHSKTTHQGHEAADCCRLMTHIIIRAINCDEDASPAAIKEAVLGDILATGFVAKTLSVMHLARSEQEPANDENNGRDLQDRNWNWKSPDHTFSPSRSAMMPGYVGSYCMDGLAMALHCVWTTDSFPGAVLKAVNKRGDADTVGAITGQIAGAIYGYTKIPHDWIETIRQWDPHNTIAIRAYKLFNHQFVQQA